MTLPPQFSHNSPLLSIITVTRNNAEGLRRTHASLTAQSLHNFNWIVIDGASHDGSLGFLRQNPPTILHSAPDAGIYDAMNRGIEYATGRMSLFLNAGDILASHDVCAKIQSQLQPDCAFAYGDALESAPDKKIHYKSARPHTLAIQGLFTHHQSMLYDTAFLKKFRYDLHYKIAADYDLTLRFLQGIAAPQTIEHMPFPICHYEPGGLSQTHPALGRLEQFEIRKKIDICSPVQNRAIYAAQMINWNIRRFMPSLYWRTKL